MGTLIYALFKKFLDKFIPLLSSTQMEAGKDVARM